MSNRTYTEDELANLSDDELENMAVPPVLAGSAQEDAGAGADDTAPAAASREEGGVEGEGDQTQGNTDDQADDDPDEAYEGDDQGDPDGPDADNGAQDPHGDTGSPEGKKADDAAKTDQKPADDQGKKKDDAPDEGRQAPAQIDYKAEYEKIMAPFKANGKEIKLQSPEEVVQLMQMGANYTKKLQALQPNLKLLKMLENNNLLDEGKISFLIDLEQKNPQAIQKLLKESGVDPLDIDTSAEPDYRPGNHKVSDEEMAFNATMEEVASIPEGKETIITINKTWDKASKEALWTDPGILRLMTDQKRSGIYDQIANEIERRRVLGQIGNHVPFLQAYRDVGMEMQQRGAFNNIRQPATGQSPAQQDPSRVVETRVKTRKPDSNSDRARAAAPTRSTPGKPQADFNPLALSDEEFEKTEQLARRL